MSIRKIREFIMGVASRSGVFPTSFYVSYFWAQDDGLKNFLGSGRCTIDVCEILDKTSAEVVGGQRKKFMED